MSRRMFLMMYGTIWIAISIADIFVLGSLWPNRTIFKDFRQKITSNYVVSKLFKLQPKEFLLVKVCVFQFELSWESAPGAFHFAIG